MYARELLMVGEREDLLMAEDYFALLCCGEGISPEESLECYSVLTRIAGIMEDAAMLMKYAMKAVLSEGCSEVCLELGRFYEQLGDLDEACIWYYNAAFETYPVLVRNTRDTEPLEALVRIYGQLGFSEQAESYRQELRIRAEIYVE